MKFLPIWFAVCLCVWVDGSWVRECRWFLEDQSHVTVMFGNSLNLSCWCTGPVVRSFCPSMYYEINQYRKYIFLLWSTATKRDFDLKFSRYRVRDVQNVTTTLLLNEVGNTYSDTKIWIRYANVLIHTTIKTIKLQENNIYTVNRNTPIEVECKWDGAINVRPTYTWMHNNEYIKNQTKATLTVMPKYQDDLGLYYCFPHFGGKDAISKGTITIQMSPILIGKQKDVVWYANGTSVTLNCNIIGYPNPQVEWLRNGLVVPYNNNSYLVGANLRLKNLTDNDSEYVCVGPDGISHTIQVVAMPADDIFPYLLTSAHSSDGVHYRLWIAVAAVLSIIGVAVGVAYKTGLIQRLVNRG